MLVPTEVTRPQEIADAPVVCDDLLAAVRHVLGVRPVTRRVLVVRLDGAGDVLLAGPAVRAVAAAAEGDPDVRAGRCRGGRDAARRARVLGWPAPWVTARRRRCSRRTWPR